MKIIPIYDRILVKRIACDTVSPGGIVIPDGAKEKPLEGEIVSQGDGIPTDDGKGIKYPLDTKVGDRVLFPKHSGTDINVGGEDLLVLREEDILAIIEDEGA
jgi:chaperonin GroES